MNRITSVYGQSMYDLCLMAYGTLDLMVKFCTDNGINDLNYVPILPQTFLYDPALVTDQKTTAYVYATAIEGAAAVKDKKYYVSQTGAYYQSQNGNYYIPVN